MNAYRYAAATVKDSYAETERTIDAIYASGRLRLPFAGVLLIGY